MSCCKGHAARKRLSVLSSDCRASRRFPSRSSTDGLRSYGAAMRETPELECALHVKVSAAERPNNLIEQSHPDPR